MSIRRKPSKRAIVLHQWSNGDRTVRIIDANGFFALEIIENDEVLSLISFTNLKKALESARRCLE